MSVYAIISKAGPFRIQYATIRYIGARGHREMPTPDPIIRRGIQCLPRERAGLYSLAAADRPRSSASEHKCPLLQPAVRVARHRHPAAPDEADQNGGNGAGRGRDQNQIALEGRYDS